ncbi:hypothetical protein ThidrDRAFT_2193 [Thiorhodococcus drewsii AZ1]|uniref:DUF4214 domain-containing protein n=1 Tax=Thiorhodococcus drewsii AZ1 TaxID=765913 RepID=G2E1N0_9GAMM|nr:DUF4214 domain-containing protein [Thiorhodococcus drewsii]EGV31088.1 hypothetical protein ThidrDRAFT_2193 [Thiorhodococcus drewsii AZ1]
MSRITTIKRARWRAFLALALLILLSGQVMAMAPDVAMSADSSGTRLSPKSSPDFPLLFVPNRGQWESDLAFLVQTPGSNVFFAADHVAFVVPDGESQSSVVSMRLLGVESDAEILPGQPLKTRFSYLRGQDPSQWRSGVPSYDSILYQGLYPGVDLVFRQDGHDLAYDFVLTPGAKPERIQVALKGVEKLALAEDGAMIMTLPNGRQMRQKAPVIYQEIDGERRPVAGRFRIQSSGSGQGGAVFGFEVAAYDVSQPLVIDPTLLYSGYMGGSKDEDARVAAVASDGGLIVAGTVASVDFPGGNESIQKKDGLLYKIATDGSDVDYVVIIGGAKDDQINDFVIYNDEIYLTGQTNSVDFPTTSGSMYPVLPGGKSQAAFIVKLDASQAIEFATYFGGTGADAGQAIDLEYTGATGARTPIYLYIAGQTSSSDLVLRDPLYARLAGGIDGFLAKFSLGGDVLYWSTYFGGSKDDSIKFIDINEDGVAYLSGETASSDLPAINNIQAYGGKVDVFLARISRASLELVSSTYIGGKSDDNLTGMALDADRNIFLGGYTASKDFPTKNALDSVLNVQDTDKGSDGFVLKIDRSAKFMRFSTFIGAEKDDKVMALALDSNYYLYVGGETSSNNFPVENAYQTYHAGGTDGFLMQLDRHGLGVLNSSYFGGVKDDVITYIGAASVTGGIIVAGNTKSSSTDSFPLIGTLYPTHGGSVDTFVAKLTGVGFTSYVPTLAFNFVTTTPEVDNDFPAPQIDVVLTLNRNNSPDGISAYSTRLYYDLSELALASFVWSGQKPSGFDGFDGLTGGLIPTEDDGVTLNTPGILEIDVRQETLTNGSLLDLDGMKLTLTFSIQPGLFDPGFTAATAVSHTPSEWGGSKQLLLKLDHPWAADTNGLELPIWTMRGGILIDRRRSDLLGDCDYNGLVRSWEFERAVLFAGKNLSAPTCMVSDYGSTMRAVDLTEIINNSYSQNPPAPKPPWWSLIRANVSTTNPSLIFSAARLRGSIIETDLNLSAAGQEIATLTTDITYDPQAFSGADAVIGASAQASGKSMTVNLIEPGWVRLLFYSIDNAPISDGVIATVRLTPNPGYGLAQTNLVHVPDASTPDSAVVDLHGSALVAGQLRDDTWRVAEIYIATLGYAPDEEGLQYWVDALASGSGWTPTEVAKSFFDQPLVQAQYPEALGYGGLIDALYENLFDRAADDAGRSYWLAELESGRIGRNEMIIAMIEGGWVNADAKDDMARFANRVEVSLAFADYQAEHDIRYAELSSSDQAYLRQIGRELLVGVTEDPVSRNEAIHAISTRLARLL